MAEDPRRPQVGGELGGAVVAVEAGGVDDAGHRPGAGPGDHVHDDAALLQRLEHAEVSHAAGRPAAEGHADADAAKVVDQPLQAVGQRPAPGRLRLGLGDLEVAGDEVAEPRHDGGHRVARLQQPGDADLVPPAAGRHVERLQPADRGLARGGRDEVDRPVDDLHQPARQFRLQVRVDVEDDAVGVLPLGRLPADFLRLQHLAVGVDRPRPHARQTPPLGRIAEHGQASRRPRGAGRGAARRPRRVAGDSWISASIIGARRGAVPKKSFRRLPA